MCDHCAKVTGQKGYVGQVTCRCDDERKSSAVNKEKDFAGCCSKSDYDSTECAEKERHKEDVAVPNVAPVRKRSMADVVPTPIRTERAAAQQENNLLTRWPYSTTRAREAAGGCCMSGCCKDHKKNDTISGGADCAAQMKDAAGGCCAGNNK